MHVPNSHRWRPKLAAGLMLTLATFTGLAQAVEFDERVRAPAMKDTVELRSQAQSLSTRYAEVRAAAPEQIITDPALAREQFDLTWKLKRALDQQRPLGDLTAVGIVSHTNGSIEVDSSAYPQWLRYDERLASLLTEGNLDLISQNLANRGFRDSDIAALRSYLATHDLGRAVAQRALPVALSFHKLVMKYDRLKRPVDEALLLSYVYQQAKLRSDSTREWAAGLLAALDAQRARILIEHISEFNTRTYWTPTDQSAALADTLAMIRRPDFEQQATTEAQGGAR